MVEVSDCLDVGSDVLCDLIECGFAEGSLQSAGYRLGETGFRWRIKGESPGGPFPAGGDVTARGDQIAVLVTPQSDSQGRFEAGNRSDGGPPGPAQ